MFLTLPRPVQVTPISSTLVARKRLEQGLVVLWGACTARQRSLLKLLCPVTHVNAEISLLSVVNTQLLCVFQWSFPAGRSIFMVWVSPFVLVYEESTFFVCVPVVRGMRSFVETVWVYTQSGG